MAKYEKRISLGYDDHGHEIRKRIYANTKTELDQKIFLAKKEAAQLRNPTEMTLERFCERWFNAYKTHKAISTQTMYKYAFLKLEPIKGIKLKELRPSDFQSVINMHWNTPTACKHLVMTIRALCHSALAEGYINYDPSYGLETPRVPKKSRRVLTDKELDAFRRANLDIMDRMYFNMLYCFGLRPGEALALMPSDFDLDRKRLTISRAVAFDTNTPYIKGTKTDNIRSIPIPSGLIPELEAYFAQNDSLYMFHMKNGGLVSKTSQVKMWARIMKAANAALGGNDKLNMLNGVTQYTFRRQYATDLYYSNISIKKAAQLMGHADTKMIMEVYAQLDDEREDLSQLDGRYWTESGRKIS